MQLVRGSWLLLALATVASAGHNDMGDKSENPSTASVTDSYMGPAAFLWPPDRVWSAAMDNTAPCGSEAGVSRRTKFPLDNGYVGLVAQDDYYNSTISISYSQEPKSNSDFEVLVKSPAISDLNPGHACVAIPNPPKHVTDGTNATLQVVYRADWDTPHRQQIFYACADITFDANFDPKHRYGCIQASEPGEDDKARYAAHHSGHDTHDSGQDTHHSGHDTADADVPSHATAGAARDGSEGTSSSKLGGGAIAGIVVGALAGVCSLAGAAVLACRFRRRKQRSVRLARMEESARRDQTIQKYPSSQNGV